MNRLSPQVRKSFPVAKPLRSFRFRIHVTLGLSLAAVALALTATTAFLQVGAQTGRQRIEKDLEQVFTVHEDIRLEPRAFAAEVRASGRATVTTQANNFRLQLRLNDLRASNYRAEVVELDGKTHPLATAPINTYKGNVEGVWASDARFTINDNSVEGMILTPTESYFVEPASKYSTAADAADYVVYRASDVRPDITRSCADPLGEQVNLGAKEFMSSANTGGGGGFSPFKLVELATEADFDYVQAKGGVSAANNNILSIMNQVQAIFERDVGLTFKVVFQHAWDTPSDPYNISGDPIAMVNEFKNYWNATFQNTARDDAHMWTGRSLGGPNGIAFRSVVCKDPASAYSISDNETMAPFVVTIPAHEIAHNFGATHSDGQGGCDNSIMVATQTQSNTSTFCQYSIDQMTAFVNANSSCLSEAVAANPIDDPTFFVRQHYLDFLNRTADQSGLNFWVGGITSCGGNAGCIEGKRTDTSAAFFLSIEFQQTGYLVERTYKTAYGDDTKTSNAGGTHNISVPIVRFTEFLTDISTIGRGVVVGQGNWEQILESNKVAYFNAFVQSNRFVSTYPSTAPPATFVATLNNNAGQPLSAAELATLTAEHTTGQKNRAQVLRQIAEHPNLARNEFNRAFVLMQYFGYLRRNPNDPPDSEYSGYEFWLSKLNQFGDYRSAEMVKAFVSSTEYRKRFGTP